MKLNSPFRNSLVVGASRGIGLSLVKLLLESYDDSRVYCTYHNEAFELKELQEQYPSRLKCFKLDPTVEVEIIDLSHEISLKTSSLDLLINTVGYLHDGEVKPEKSLKDINLEKLVFDFKLNSCVTPLLAKVFKSYLKSKDKSYFVSLSAKVGSISDNRVGGWYGYRASKAALNMFIKTISIEYKRSHMNTNVLAIHPGTTITELSRPFIANTKYQLHSTDETASNIISVILNSSADDQFYSWDGDVIPW